MWVRGDETLRRVPTAFNSHVGPIIISIADGDNNTYFRDYAGNLCSKDKQCGAQNDHDLLLVVVVGYDSNFYILKKSYEDDWGGEGYMILPRPDMHCGMLIEGDSYPNIGI